MIDISKSKLQQLVCQYTADVGKAEQRVISKNGFETQAFGMEESLMSHT